MAKSIMKQTMSAIRSGKKLTTAHKAQLRRLLKKARAARKGPKK
jgi:hypothetical protein